MQEILESYYKKCSQCPRKCLADRTVKKGLCDSSSTVDAALACLHFGEEPLITVHGGSGTVFFTGCTLRCAFCQNYQISQQGMGRPLSQEDFVKVCLLLQKLGAENINLVTPSHNIPLIANFIRASKDAGVTIPFAWNSSAYESVKMLELLKDLVDIYLPDLKTLDPSLSKNLFKAKDYPQVAKDAVSWMIENAPLKIQSVKKDGLEKEKIFSGVIIRHLFLPGNLEDTINVLEWLKSHADKKCVISLMSQYTPVPFKGSQEEIEGRKKALSVIENRLVSKEEDNDLRDLIEAYDFDFLFYQDLSDDTDWLPDFSRDAPFSNALAKNVWHWKKGFLLAN